jgi:ankyrin repeat protein
MVLIGPLVAQDFSPAFVVQDFSPDLVAQESGRTSLVEAAVRQDRTAVRELLKHGVGANTTRADGATALLWAAHWGDQEMIDALLDAGANVNLGDDHGVTPLARASENADPTIVQRLLTAGADPNVRQTSGLGPLMIAARTGNVRVAKALLVHGADANASTTDTKATALMWAVAEPHPEIVRLLIEAKADVTVSTVKGITPLMFAARNGDIEMGKLLLEAGARVNDRGSEGIHPLPYALLAGQFDFAQFLLDQGADPNGSIDGVRAIHAAVGGAESFLEDWTRRQGGNAFGAGLGPRGGNAARRLQLVKALLARGADPNARTMTSSMFMSYIGYPTKGAFEPFATGTGDLRGATPLWLAAYVANGSVGGFGGDGAQGAQAAGGEATARVDGSVEIIRVLLAAGADQHLTSVDGTTPLMLAAGLGRATFFPGLPRGRRSPSAEEAVRTLLDAGANVNAVNEADFSALHGAAFRGLNEVIQILVERGADINARDYRGRTPYRIAEGAKQSFQFQAYPETAAFLARLGANTRLSIPGTIHERLRDVAGFIVANQQP